MRNKNLAAVVVVLLSLAAGTAFAGGGAYRKYKGKIMVAAEQFPIDADETELVASIKQMATTTVSRGEGGGSWSFHILGFLSKKPGASAITLVIYPTKGAREPLWVSEIAIDPKATIMAADASVTEDDGIKPGEKYEVVLGRMVRGKETIYARTKITFK